MRTISIAVLALIALAGHARADAIDGPPACPPGARGRSAHEGQWCVAWPCSADAECEGGTCRAWRVCTQTSMVAPGGLRPQPPPEAPRELVLGTCDPARACTGTDEPPPPIVGRLEADAPTCSDATYCVPPGLPAFPGRGSGTSASGGSGGAAPPTESARAPETPAAPGGTCGCGAAGRAASSLAALAIAILGIAIRRSR